jgi:hypothetical protein
LNFVRCSEQAIAIEDTVPSVTSPFQFETVNGLLLPDSSTLNKLLFGQLEGTAATHRKHGA